MIEDGRNPFCNSQLARETGLWRAQTGRLDARQYRETRYHEKYHVTTILIYRTIRTSYTHTNILIAEDAAKTAAYLCKGLTENGFVVDLADNGEDGLELAILGKHDQVILDVVLPLCDGWTILTRMRSNHLQSLVMLLTARDSVPDRVKGLDLGADDPVMRPAAATRHITVAAADVQALSAGL